MEFCQELCVRCPTISPTTPPTPPITSSLLNSNILTPSWLFRNLVHSILSALVGLFLSNFRLLTILGALKINLLHTNSIYHPHNPPLTAKSRAKREFKRGKPKAKQGGGDIPNRLGAN